MSALSDLNYIKNMMRHPLATPSMSVMIMTGLQAGAVAVADLISMGALDIMAARTGKPHIHHKGLKGILGDARKTFPRGPAAVAASFGIGLARGGLFYPWIAGVGTSFVANWMNLIYQEQKCTEPGNGYAKVGLSSIFIGSNDHDVQGQALIDGLVGKPCFAIGGNKVTVPFGCSANVSYAARFGPFNNDPHNASGVEHWLEDQDGNKFPGSASNADPDTGLVECGGGARPPSGAFGQEKQYTIQFVVKKGGTMGLIEGFVEVSSYGRKYPLVTAGANPKKVDWPFPTN